MMTNQAQKNIPYCFSHSGLGKPKNRGIALITVLLVMVVATIMATAMIKDQNISIHRALNFFENDQAREYVLGGEEIARQVLYTDFTKTPTKDHESEPWGEESLEYEFERGLIQLKIRDLQAGFNLNSLLDTSAQGALNKKRFNLLLNFLSIDLAFSDRIADWIDPDQNPRQLGAEDYHYLGLDVPYRTGSTYMEDVSELRLMLEIDDDIFRKLAPHVTTLPTYDSAINVNTAGPELLMSLARQISQAQVDQALEAREPDGYNDLQGFERMMGSPPDLVLKGLSVNSSYFQAEVVAIYNGRKAYLTSILERNPVDGTIKVIYRDFSKKMLYSPI